MRKWHYFLIKPVVVIPSRHNFIQEWYQIYPEGELMNDI